MIYIHAKAEPFQYGYRVEKSRRTIIGCVVVAVLGEVHDG